MKRMFFYGTQCIHSIISSSRSRAAAAAAAAAARQRRSVPASDDTWRTEINCAFPGQTAKRCCSYCARNKNQTGCFGYLRYACAESAAFLYFGQ